MEFSTFTQLLQAKNPGATAEVINPTGLHTARGTRTSERRVMVTFRPDGKAYDYRGTIASVAERLELIPAVDYTAEARRVADALRSGQSEVFASAPVGDTVRAVYGVDFDVEPAGRDEYNRQQFVYRQPNANDPWRT